MARKLRKSPEAIAPVTASSKAGPSGAKPYGPSARSLCERSPLATKTARRPSFSTALAAQRPSR